MLCLKAHGAQTISSYLRTLNAQRGSAQTIVFVMPGKAMALKLRVSSSENSHRSNHYIRSVWELPSAETITCVVPNVLSNFVVRWKYLSCQAKSNSCIFEEAASESIVFVVSESSQALKVSFPSTKCGGPPQTTIFVMPGSSWPSNHSIRSAWELLAFKPLYS